VSPPSWSVEAAGEGAEAGFWSWSGWAWTEKAVAKRIEAARFFVVIDRAQMLGNSMGSGNSELRVEGWVDREIRFLKFPFHLGQI
jgi:hypothetical protein